MGTKKLPRGISQSPNGTVYISFQYLGSQCREPKAGFTTTKADQNYLVKLKGEIERKIEDRTFIYADYFPESKRLQRYGALGTNSTVEDFLLERLKLDEEVRELASTTLRGYNICTKRLKPLHKIPVSQLDTAHVATFVRGLRNEGSNPAESGGTLKRKTIKDTLNFLNKALKLAITQKHLRVNPLDAFHLQDFVSVKASRAQRVEVDPFSPEEVDSILANQRDETLQNYYTLRFYSGLTVSEANALSWRDVDLRNKKLRVRGAFVLGELKDTKTEGRDRLIDLEPEVIGALIAQKSHTFLAGGYIFLSPQDGKPFQEDHKLRLSFWIPALKQAGVRYRPPKQTRHTYACMMISRGRNLWWLKNQMGHSSLKMLERHYGDFMKAYQDSFSESTASPDYSNVLSLYRTSF